MHMDKNHMQGNKNDKPASPTTLANDLQVEEDGTSPHHMNVDFILES